MMLYESTAENSFKGRRHSILETLTKLYFEFIYLQFRIKVKWRKDRLYCLFEERNLIKKILHKRATVQTQKACSFAFGKAYRSRNETVSSLPLSKRVLGSGHRELGHSFGSLWNSEGYPLPATHALLVPRLQQNWKSKMLNNHANLRKWVQFIVIAATLI